MNYELITHMLETASKEQIQTWAFFHLEVLSRDALEHEHLVLHEDQEAL